MIRGVISRVFEKKFGDDTAFSFRLQNDETFYRAGKRLLFQEGDAIQFEVELKNNNAYARGIQKWVEGGEATAAPATNVVQLARASGPSKGDYQATQARIELQSCRNSALELVKMLLQAEAFKLPTKVADKESALYDAVNHYTDLFLKQNAAGSPLAATTAVEPLGEEAPKKASGDDSNW